MQAHRISPEITETPASQALSRVCGPEGTQLGRLAEHPDRKPVKETRKMCIISLIPAGMICTLAGQLKATAWRELAQAWQVVGRQSTEGTGLAGVVVPAVQNHLGDTPPGVCAMVSLERIN